MSRSKKSRIPQGEYNAHIDSLSHEGRGIADIEGKKVFISGVMPGEDVTFEYRYVKRRLAQGQAIHIENPHPDRQEPKCAAYQVCGGCSLQHVNENSAIAFKQGVVLEQLKHFAQVTPLNVLEPLTGPSWGYRTKARMGVRYVPKKGGVLLGFREKFSNRIALMDRCEVLDPKVGHLIEPLKTLLETLSIKEQIPQIEVAISEDVTALVLRHLVPLEGQDKEAVCAFCKEFNLTLYSQPKGVDSVVKLYPEESPFYLSYRLEDYDITIDFHPLDFTQVNTDINRQMIGKALAELDLKPEEKVLDLFCGIGNFTLPMARYTQHMTGVEGSESAIERANMNKTKNNLSHVDFYVEDLFKESFEGAWASKDYDKVLLDPPRSGALALMSWFKEKQPRRIVYVSCNPATMARDAGVLVNELGYQLTNLRVMDMFPHTAHVESMATFDIR